MKFWGQDNPLTQAWEVKVRQYFDLVEALTGHHYHDTRITTKEEMSALHDEFSERFGKEGDKLVGAVAMSSEFNGKEKPGDAQEYFPGMEYSIPLIFYVARRAMEKETPAHAYDIFVNDILSYGEKKGYEIDRVPTRWFIEELTEPYLDQLAELEGSPDNLIDISTPEPDGENNNEPDDDQAMNM